jgi:hypothetical protein
MLAPSIFVGSSAELGDVAEALSSIVRATFPCTYWRDAFPLSGLTLESLEEAARQNRFGVFVGRGEDVLNSRGRVEGTVRTNVLGEFLLFVGKNGRDHAYLVLDRSNLPKLPSDLDGLAYSTFDYSEFRHNPSGALRVACDQIVRRVTDVHAGDVERARELERLIAAEQGAQDLLQLAETASLLRDVIDAVQRDTLEALLDEQKFAGIKSVALDRIEEIAGPNAEKAASSGVGREFAELKGAVLRAVAALPFPNDVFAGIDDARATYERSALASFPVLAAAIDRKDWGEALRIAAGLRGRISPDTLLQEVAMIVEQRLHRLKSGYSAWWRANSRSMRASLGAFQSALMRAQTRTAMKLLDDRMRDLRQSPR